MIHKHRDEVGHFTIEDFLTPAQIAEARAIYLYHRGVGQSFNTANQIAHEIIQPNMASIDSKLGQQNDAKYLAYVVQHAFDGMEL